MAQVPVPTYKFGSGLRALVPADHPPEHRDRGSRLLAFLQEEFIRRAHRRLEPTKTHFVKIVFQKVAFVIKVVVCRFRPVTIKKFLDPAVTAITWRQFLSQPSFAFAARAATALYVWALRNLDREASFCLKGKMPNLQSSGR